MEELKLFRISHQMNTTEFAKSIGVSESLYVKVELGFRKPSRNFMEKLKKSYPSFDINKFFCFQ